jgi:hypothetical protein
MDINEPLIDSHNTILKDSFILKLYYYYIHRGYYNLVSTQIVNLLTTIFLYTFIVFLFNCVNYSGLFGLEEKGYLSDYIIWDKFFHFDTLGWFCFVLFCIFIFCKVLSLVDDIINYYPIKRYYNKRLFISDSQIISVKWIYILNKVKSITDDQNLDIYLVTNKIMAQDNYMISLIDKGIITPIYMTKLMEWNIKYTIIQTLFNDKNKINEELFNDNEKFHNQIKTKIRIVSFFNFIFMPLIFIFVTFYSICKYGEMIYNKPELINSRNWTLLSKWKFREYNELYHLFHERLNNSNLAANDYVKQFPSKILETFSKLIVFILSSLFLFMLFLTLVNENLLINLQVSESRPILWYMGILGTFIAISKGFIIDKYNFYPKEKLIKVKESIDAIPDEWIESANKLYIKKQFCCMYEYQISGLLKEMFYILIMPFELWFLSYKTKEIVDFVVDHTEYDIKLGYICSLASFSKRENIQNDYADKKTISSFKNFIEEYDDWFKNKVESNSIRINIINYK